MPNHFPRSAAVQATKLTADTATFILNFNHGRTTYPFAMDNGRVVYIVTGPGAATEVPIGDWVIENVTGVEVHTDADFCAKFCQAAS
jgi:hypothetical protein